MKYCCVFDYIQGDIEYLLLIKSYMTYKFENGEIKIFSLLFFPWKQVYMPELYR